MDKQTIYRAMAQRMVAKYTSGECTLKHLESEIYDPKLGVNTPTYKIPNDVVDMVIGKITDKLKINNIASNKQLIIYIAGDDIPTTTPEIGDVIIISNGDSVKIYDLDVDQYRALFKIVAHRK